MKSLNKPSYVTMPLALLAMALLGMIAPVARAAQAGGASAAPPEIVVAAGGSGTSTLTAPDFDDPRSGEQKDGKPNPVYHWTIEKTDGASPCHFIVVTPYPESSTQDLGQDASSTDYDSITLEAGRTTAGISNVQIQVVARWSIKGGGYLDSPPEKVTVPVICAGIWFAPNSATVPWSNGGTYRCLSDLKHPGIPANHIAWSITGSPKATVNNGVVTFSGQGGGQYTVTASAILNGRKMSDTFSLTVVSLTKIQYKSGNTWQDVPATLNVKLGSTVSFRAIPQPQGVSFPQGYARWSGVAHGSGSTINVTFKKGSSSVRDYKTLSAECGVTRKVNILVVEYTPGVDPTAPGVNSKAIHDQGGDVQIINGQYHIPMGGVNHFSAVLKDEDSDTFGRTYQDSFAKKHAIHWVVDTLRGGKAIPEYGLNTTFTATTDQAAKTDSLRIKVIDDGKYYQDLDSRTQVASIVMHLDTYSGVSSIEAEDGPDRHSSSLLECVGTTNVMFRATPEDPSTGFAHGYPKWTIGKTTKTGAVVYFDLSSKFSHQFGYTTYIAKCIGKAGAAPNYVSVRIYDANHWDVGWDFKKIADDLNKTMDLKDFEKLQLPDGEIEFSPPNGKAICRMQWVDLNNNHVMLDVFGSVGLHPVVGIGAKIQLIGPPSFITKYLAKDSEAGLFLTLEAKGDVKAGVGRWPNSVGTAPTYHGGGKGTIDITGGVTLGGKINTKYASVDVEANATTGIHGAISVSIAKTGLSWTPSATWSGLDISVIATFSSKLGHYEYSEPWTVLEPVPIYNGENDRYYLVKWSSI